MCKGSADRPAGHRLALSKAVVHLHSAASREAGRRAGTQTPYMVGSGPTPMADPHGTIGRSQSRKPGPVERPRPLGRDTIADRPMSRRRSVHDECPEGLLLLPK